MGVDGGRLDDEVDGVLVLDVINADPDAIAQLSLENVSINGFVFGILMEIFECDGNSSSPPNDVI